MNDWCPKCGTYHEQTTAGTCPENLEDKLFLGTYAEGHDAGYRAGVEAMRDEMKTDVAKFYPADIFPEPPKGQHGKTVDSCSAAAVRAIVPGLADMIAARLLEEKP